MSTVISPAQAADWLRTGAVGVGEAHNDSDSIARKFTKELIEKGHAKALFIECRSNEQAGFDTAAQRKDYDQIRQVVGSLEPKTAGSAKGPKLDESPVFLFDLAVAAVQNDVPVYFIDKDVGRGNNTRSPNPTNRDKHAQSEFERITQGRTGGVAGCLVHYGLLHFDKTMDPYHQCYRADEPNLAELLNLGLVLFHPK